MEEQRKPASKTYRVRVPMYLAEKLDEKLKKENRKYSDIAREGIEKYLKKNK